MEWIQDILTKRGIADTLSFHHQCNHVRCCYDPPHFSPLPYPSSPTQELVSFDLKPVVKHTTKPPVIFPSAMPPEYMGKQPLPLNPPSLSPLEDLPPKPEWTRPATPRQTRPVTPQWSSPSQVVMTRPPFPAMSIYPSFDLSPAIPEIPFTPWDTHRREHSSMEHFTEPPIVEQPPEDSPIEDVPTVYYLPDIPGGTTHTLAPGRPLAEPWREHYEDIPPPVSCKHSRSPTSPDSAPIRQRTSREGSYHSITPTASSPIASTSPQSQGNQTISSEEPADTSSSTQSSADDVDSNMALNWVTINTDYLKG